VLNAIVVGLAIDATLLALPDTAPLAVRAVEVLAGIALVGIGSGLYLSTVLGPGPRDGLMTALHRLTGRPVALVRTAIELTALVVGVLLGGRFGVGTIALALLMTTPGAGRHGGDRAATSVATRASSPGTLLPISMT
jgi:uncharacterized membrane protein YczE